MYGRHVLISFVRAATSSSPSSDSWNRRSFFLPPAAPKNSQFGSTMRPLITTLISSLWGVPPTRRDLASDTKFPSFSDREALRASAHSLVHSCKHSILYLHLRYPSLASTCNSRSVQQFVTH